MKKELYYKEVLGELENIRKEVHSLSLIDNDLLKNRPNPKSWSPLECIEHLNLTMDVYLPNIRKAIQNTKSVKNHSFNPGIFDRQIIKSLELKSKGNVKFKMKTFDFFKPDIKTLESEQVFKNYFNNSSEFEELIHKSKSHDLNKTKVNSALGSVFKLKLGVVFKFLINHEKRHLEQAKKSLIQS